MLDIFFNGVDTLDARTRSRHFVFADEKFSGRREERNNFGVRAGKRNSFPHDSSNDRRGGVDKIFGDGVINVKNFRCGVFIFLSVRCVQICAGGQKTFAIEIGREKFISGTV